MGLTWSMGCQTDRQTVRQTDTEEETLWWGRAQKFSSLRDTWFIGKNHLSVAGPIWKLFLPFLSLERWTCQFLSIYRGKGLSIASEAEKAFREGGREGFFIPFSFSFVLYFFPLAVGQPGLSTQEENEAYLNHFCWYSATCLNYPLPDGVPCPSEPRQSWGRLPRTGKVAATRSMQAPGFLSATVLQNK